MSLPPRAPRGAPPEIPLPAVVWDVLTFDKLLTVPVAHLVYWAGLGLISLFGFGVLGGAIGMGLRDGSLVGVALAFALLVGGALATTALVLIWRGVSEFFLAVFRIAEDLRALRAAVEAAPAAASNLLRAETPPQA